MKNIKILKTGIDVAPILKDLRANPSDWGAQEQIAGVGNLVSDFGFPTITAGVLQLVMGGVESADQYVGDSEICIPTPAMARHMSVLHTVARELGVTSISRCGFLSLPVGGSVGTHIDIGTYYQSRDRYHLAIQGNYLYHVGDEEVLVEPGMLLWFDNKLPHGTKNVGDVVRITFVFDVEHKEK